MAVLSDYQAKGVEFPDLLFSDVDALLEQIPEYGTLHLAILRQPYLDLIMEGTKTIESRFNTRRAAPFGRVAVGDLVLLKETAQPITNYFFVSSVASLDLGQTSLAQVRAEYGQGIQAQDEELFWQERRKSKFATLLGVGERGEVEPLPIVKKDQRGWVTFTRRDRQTPTLF